MIRTAKLAGNTIKTYLLLSCLGTFFILYLLMASASLKIIIPWVICLVFYFMWKRERKINKTKPKRKSKDDE